MYYSDSELDKEIDVLTSALDKVQKELDDFSSSLPAGRYCLRTNRSYPRFSLITGSKDTRKDSSIALRDSPDSVSHIRRYYLLLLIPALQAELNALKTFRAHYTPMEKYRIYADLPEAMRNLLNPTFSPFEVRAQKWADAHYIRNDMEFDESQRYDTKTGIRVRSRAEMLFADLLSTLGLYYRYEMRYRLPDGSFVYPDFAVMHPLTGEVHYIEYFGLMDNSDYRNKALRKIQQYYASKDASRFHFFFESNEVGFNIVAIQNALNQIFLSE